MRRNLLIVVVLAVAGTFAWRELFSGEKRACRRYVSLCGEEKRADCESLFEQARAAGGDELVDFGADCFTSANSCAQAVGCSTGVSARLASAAVGGFFKGLSGGK